MKAVRAELNKSEHTEDFSTPGTQRFSALNKLFIDIANDVGGVRPTALPADKVQAFEARCADIKVAPDGMPAEIPF